MTTDSTDTAAPSTITSSPPAKRVKTDSTAMDNGNTVPITNLNQSPPLLIKKLSDKARLPTRGSTFAAGYDLYAARETTVPARGKGLVDTDISMAVPAGTCMFPVALSLSSNSTTTTHPRSMLSVIKDGRIAPRSGLAAKNFIDTGAGVIDADYRGQVKVLLFNHSDQDFVVVEGDRVAQLVLERIYTPEVVEVAELEESVRGAGGFGSTGTN